MERLILSKEQVKLYQAGLPHFPRNFTRDSIISAMLMKDYEMLKDQLAFCSIRQGKKKDAITGEEPGKIFHEYPGFEIGGLFTDFNACDTTALYIIGHLFYQENTQDTNLAMAHKDALLNAVEYILSHVKEGFFYEDPKFSGGSKFALKVTYWKDSALMGRQGGEPVYPVVYPLAHIQNMHALRCASILLGDEKLMEIANEMKGKIKDLYDEENGTFYLAIDQLGAIKGVTSDALHALHYLREGDLSLDQLQSIANSSIVLETPLGYRTMEKAKENIEDTYHTKTIWPFEQAMIHHGATKFGLDHIAKVSQRVATSLDSEPEIFVLEDEGIKKGGCDPQLWTIAAKKYFSSMSPPGFEPGTPAVLS